MVKKTLASLPPDSSKEERAALEKQRLRYIKTHIHQMLALFLVAYGVPATMRFASLTALPSLILASVFWLVMCRYYFNKLTSQLKA